MSKVAELFGVPTSVSAPWSEIVAARQCPFLHRLCLKNRKSRPDILIGTCTVVHGRKAQDIIICPHRFLERRQIFQDCVHLLAAHEPGNELHIVPEVTIPGGSVDYFLVSSRTRKVMDFVGIELQALDSTGTVWPERQRFLEGVGVAVDQSDAESVETFGINWKMTAKTTLVQLLHKIETFEHIGKHLALVYQDGLQAYMRRAFAFGHIVPARLGDSMHFHTYSVTRDQKGHMRLELAMRSSTDAAGVSQALGLQASGKVEIDVIMSMLEAKISDKTLFAIDAPLDTVPHAEPS